MIDEKQVTLEDIIAERDKMSAYGKASFDEKIAIKILGSLGLRNHYKDLAYQNRVIDEQLEVGKLRPQDVECMIVIAKIRNEGKLPEQDTYNVHGCLIGSEQELMCLDTIVAARIRRFRELLKEEQANGVVESKPN